MGELGHQIYSLYVGGKGLGLLTRVRMLRAGIDLELFDDLAIESVLGQHALDGVLQNVGGLRFENSFQWPLLETAGIPAEPGINLFFQFVVAVVQSGTQAFLSNI